jgi:hypothetical protein
LEITNASDRIKSFTSFDRHCFDLHLAERFGFCLAGLDRLLAMSHSLIGADKRIHLKIVGVSAILGVVILLACWSMRPGETRQAAVRKASPIVVTSQVDRTFR